MKITLGKYKFTSYIILSLAFTFISCQKKEESSSTDDQFQSITAPFLTASSFTSANENTLLSSDFPSAMNEISNLWHYQASSGTSTTNTETCQSEFLIHLKTTDTFYVGGSKNLTSCMAPLMNSDSMTLSKFSMSIYLEMQCEGVDLTSFDGLPYTEARNSEIETACGHSIHHYLMNGMLDIDLTFTFMGTTTRTATTTNFAKMMADGTGCTNTFNGTNWATTDGCTDYSITHHNPTGVATDNTDDIETITDHSLITSEVSTDPFFVSGTKSVYKNGWTGIVTYNGVNTPATWTMTLNSSTQTGSLATAFFTSQINLINKKMRPLR